jgi:heparan-alpha-glucosaminide N-acetyltransferase
VSVIVQSAKVGQAQRAVPAPRVVSIDIFRGLTMAVMIFVNELSSARGLPWWTYHAPADVNVMTYVDMVFPFFLFLVGMSLPLSVEQRLRRNPSIFALWQHIILRAFSLIVLGFILANAEKADAVRMGFSGAAWALAALISAALYLNHYVKSERYDAYFRALRLLGLVGVISLFALFRRRMGSDGHAAWIDCSYPEILGLIGYAYFSAALLYIPTRRRAWAPAAWFVVLVLLCALSTAKEIAFPGHIPLYLWPVGNGALVAMVMAGVVTTLIFLGRKSRPTPRDSMARALGFSLLMFAVGGVLAPLGISKIRATPTWCLYSAAAAVLVFTLLFWICDVKQWKRWASFLLPVGSNPLLTYLLPDLWYFLMVVLSVTYLDTHWNAGWPAVVKALLFVFSMIGVATALTKIGIRIQL